MDHDSEKSGAGAQHVPDLETQNTHKSYQELAHDVSPEEGKKIIRRVDRRLVTMVGVLYCVSLMDRTNLSAASIAGMMTELELIGNRYVRQPIFDPPFCVSHVFAAFFGGFACLFSRAESRRLFIFGIPS